jgi:hypothetical protein
MQEIKEFLRLDTRGRPWTLPRASDARHRYVPSLVQPLVPLWVAPHPARNSGMGVHRRPEKLKATTWTRSGSRLALPCGRASAPWAPHRPVAGLDQWRANRDDVAPMRTESGAHRHPQRTTATSARQPSADHRSPPQASKATPVPVSSGTRLRRALGEHLITLSRGSRVGSVTPI